MKNGTTQIELIENGSVTSPAGFLAAGVVAGFKKSKKSDFAMLFSQYDCNAAGTFTSRSVRLSSTVVSPTHVPEKKVMIIPANPHG